MQSVFENWLVELGVEPGLAALGATGGGVLAVLVLALVADLVAKRVLVRAVVGLTERTETQWDNVVAERRVFHRLAHLAPALVIYLGAPGVLSVGVTATTLVQAACLLYMIVVVVSVLDGALNALVDLIRVTRFGERLPLTTFAQVVKLVLYGLAGIAALSILMDESPALLFSGLGAMTAVLMLIFKDPILGFVGGIQLSANQMVRRGDWIEMPMYGADGDVLEVALTTVKVQNFDKTITTIPTYALISESFKNWRGMAESEGRRIKRAIHLDLNSIKFCDDALLTRLTRVPYMADYLAQKRQEIDTWNGGHDEGSSTAVHPRRLT
ncbi:MAG: mechanosensitive ion channel domain-containing protein, partial [bacterium]